MDSSLQSQLKLLQRRKQKAEQSGDVLEEAKLCNAAGELLSQHGYYEKAVKEHKREVQLSEAAQDNVGSAIAHRKVGECLCSLGKYKDALFHQDLHLQLSKTAKNLIEEQRALATIGRTWFVYSDSVSDPDEVEESLLNAQAAYQDSLSVCDKLRDSVPEKELLQMRSRLYLNLGLIYDSRDDLPRSHKFMENALSIARDQALRETEYKCLYSLGAMKVKTGHMASALRHFEEALQLARKRANHFDEADALEQIGQVLVRLGNFPAGKKALKAAYKIARTRLSDDISNLKSSLVSAIKGVKLQKKRRTLSQLPTEEQINLLENLGDLYCQVKAFDKALDCYKEELKLAKSAGKPPKALSSICVSLAITYSDLKRYDDALQCYQEELRLMDGNYKEMCDTWCNVANVHENAGHSYDKIECAYLKALENAVLADSDQAQLRVHRCLADTQKKVGKMSKHAESRRRIQSLEETVGVEDDDEEEEEEGKSEMMEDSDEDGLIATELRLPDSDEEEEDDDNAESAADGSTQRRPRPRNRTINRVNEKGETPLHRAAIDGNLDVAKHLLEKGACVNRRDYCGWQPIHEASNHGHKEIVAALLDSGADVDDAGGAHCEGITPLYDAAINGHVEVVKLLVARGAAVSRRNKYGETALDAVSKAIKSDERKSGEDTELEIGRKKIAEFLRHAPNSRSAASTIQQSALRHRMIMPPESSDSCDSEEEASLVLGLREPSEAEGSSEDSFEERGGVVCRKRTNFAAILDSPLGLDDLDGLPGGVDGTAVGEGSVSRGIGPDSNCWPPSPDPVDLAHSLRDDISDRFSDDFGSPSGSMDEDGVDVPHAVRGEGDIRCGVNRAWPSVRPAISRAPIALQPETADRSTNDDSRWLVDDLGPRKRRRQSKVTSAFQRIGTAGSGGMGRKSAPSGGLRSKAPRARSRGSAARPKQTRLEATRGMATSRPDASRNAGRPSRHLSTNVSDQASRFGTSTAGSGPGAPGPSSRGAVSATSVTTPARVPQAATSPRGTEQAPGPFSGSDLWPSPGALTTRISPETMATVRGPLSVPPMRIRVRVQGKTFLIPCPTLQGGEAKSVGWLAEQASLRYFSSCGLRPVLALQTGEGASLSAEDKITDVLTTNEEVVGCVESWDLPPLTERYKTACLNAGTEARADLVKLLGNDPQLASLSIPNVALRGAHALPLFRALQCHEQLTKLQLPGNRLGDSGLQHLASAASSLPNLAVLDVRANAITALGLDFLVAVVDNRNSPNAPNRQGAGALRKLEELDVAHNNLRDSADTPLAALLRACPLLVTMRLDACDFSCEMFTRRRQLAETLKGSRLQHLTVAHNGLEAFSVASLLGALPVTSLVHLDLTSTLTKPGIGNENPAVKGLLDFLDQEKCCVRTVIFADCHLKDTDLEMLLKAPQVMRALQTLDLSCNDLSDCSVPSLIRLLNYSKSLTTLNLSGNENLGNRVVDTLTQLTSSTIQVLDLSACGIKSPLHEQSARSLAGLSHSSEVATALRELDLSHNALSSEDKTLLAHDWDTLSEGTGSCRLRNALCIFSRTTNEESPVLQGIPY